MFCSRRQHNASSEAQTLKHSTTATALLFTFIEVMGCLPVRGDNPQALASGLSCVQVDKHGITILYQLHQCRPCTTQDISC